MDVVCVGVLPKMVVREVVAVAEARQVIMLILSIGILRVVVAVAPRAVLMVVTDPPDPLADLTLPAPSGPTGTFQPLPASGLSRWRGSPCDERCSIPPRSPDLGKCPLHGCSRLLQASRLSPGREPESRPNPPRRSGSSRLFRGR
jgi:hypothetical protein